MTRGRLVLSEGMFVGRLRADPTVLAGSSPPRTTLQQPPPSRGAEVQVAHFWTGRPSRAEVQADPAEPVPELVRDVLEAAGGDRRARGRGGVGGVRQIQEADVRAVCANPRKRIQTMKKPSTSARQNHENTFKTALEARVKCKKLMCGPYHKKFERSSANAKALQQVNGAVSMA